MTSINGLFFRRPGVAHLPAVLDCLACGRFHPGHVTHRVVDRAVAADAMTDAGPKLIFRC